MIGFIIVTHNKIGSEMIAAVTEILKENNHIKAIAVTHSTPHEKVYALIKQALSTLTDCSGIVLLVDLPGATPANLCRDFIKADQIEMLTGFNLPILLKAASTNFHESAAEVALFLRNYGRDNIAIFEPKLC